ncbi:MAG: tubulin-like doman-containing protein [Candidatus Cloacimonadaceae bacterium]|jgi:hypothetical protein|nr:tubulin-like doman-containing protein [Candidatus Cloacimonadota bacterium]MCB5260166.1 tubulin-like doman-containing protein [Candidatus Cloacimonadota bacterium]MCK9242763.1 tubulin-like doman-containing protein [Candidatus Cloacimonadota bacterium]MDY0126598.1 tubulin-like doman-containing protein [Candidatus Cloacimonadaceae bacterium]
MSIQDKVREGTGEHKKASAAMKKTLFIGLGGSGKEVLMRLRRKFYGANENKYGYDFIRYLWIDTDTAGTPICDENWEVIGENIRFGVRNSIDEVFNASIDRDTLSSFYEKINAFPHIRHWFPAEALKPLGYEALLYGAKGIRPLGRLAFSWHSSDILLTLEQNISKLDRQFDVSGVELDNEIDVYIVGSLAGGTGSGMFLELAKLLKSNWPSNSVYGIFFLSDMFAEKGDNEYRDANCYAALQELDFYQTAANSLDPLIGKERHMFEFVDSEGITKKFNLPLYSNVFLVSNEYYKSPKENLFSDPFEMVAEIFYFDFDKSPFGAFKRQNTVNTKIVGSQASVEYIMPDQETGNDIKVESIYHSDYSSFALSGIFLNVSKMKTWASYKYIVDLLSNLLKDNPNNNQLFESPDGGFRISKLNFEEILHQITHGSRPNSVYEDFIHILTTKKQKKLQDVEAKITFDHTNVSKVQQVCQQQFADIDAFVQNELGTMNRELIEYERIPGPTLDKLLSNLNSGLNDTYSEIEKLMYDILANYHDGGITVATQMLDRVKALVNQMDVNQNNYANDVKRLKESLKEEKPDHPEVHIDSRISGLLQRIQDSDEIPWVFPLYKDKAKKYYDRNLSHEIDHMNREIKKQIGDYFNSCLELIKKRFEVKFKEKIGELVNQYRTRIIDMVDSVEVTIPNVINPIGMNKQIREFKTHLTSLHAYFKRYELSLKTEISVKLNRKMILDKDVDQDKIYQSFKQRLNGDDWFASQISSWFLNLINEAHNTNDNISSSMEQFVKIITFYNYIASKTKLEIRPALRQACRKEFNNFMEDKSAMDQLVESIRTDEATYRQSVGGMLDNFNFRLALSLAYTKIKQRIENTSMVRIVGLPEPNEYVESFLSGLGKVKNFQYHGSKESILFYAETFGFPLFMLKNIEHLKTEFVRNCEAGANNKYHRYTDIVTDYLKPLVIPQSSEDMQEFLHCWEVLYEAIVLHLIRYDNKNWVATIENPERFNVEENITFGKTLDAAVMKLKNNKKLMSVIKDKSSDLFAEKYNQKESIEQIWFALFSNYEDIRKFVSDQFQENKPKIPQEYVLERLLTKYLDKYCRIESISNMKDGQKNLTTAYKDVMKISSGYQDSVHRNGVKVYPC